MLADCHAEAALNPRPSFTSSQLVKGRLVEGQADVPPTTCALLSRLPDPRRSSSDLGRCPLP